MKKALLLAPALALAACGALAPTPAVADGTGHSLRIYHQPSDSNVGFLVCKDWSGTSSVRLDCPSAEASLPPGKQTDTWLGWPDTDGIRIPHGYMLKLSRLGPDLGIYGNCYTDGRARWKKLSPYIYNGTDRYKLYLKKVC